MSTETDSLQSAMIDMRGVAIAGQANAENLVLENVNWTVNAGEYWVIAGMHGSGKSDFVSATAGLTAAAHGFYQLFGHDMPITNEEHLADRLRMGVVFEGGQLLQHLTVEANVGLPLRYHRPQTPDGEVETILKLTELMPWADSTPGALSRSWQKRAGLARALILKPELLLLDDPLGGLDPRHVHWCVNFLKQLSAGHEFMDGRKVTIVATTEDLRPWRNIGGHFAILQDKKFVPLGHCPDLAANPQPLVKELLAEHL